MRARVQKILQRAAFFLRDGVEQNLGAAVVQMEGQDRCAVPEDGAFGDVPVEHGDAGRLRGEPQAQIFVDCAQLDASIRTGSF